MYWRPSAVRTELARLRESLPASLLVGLVLGLVLPGPPALAVPSGFVDEEVVRGLDRPVAMAFAPDGRLLVTEQSGAIRVVRDDALLATPFAALDVDSGGERGLLGLAFDPDFAGNGFLYVYHTVPGSPPHNRVSRLTADGDVARDGSLATILDLDDLSSQRNHNGGDLLFGRDGKLYVGVGENNYRPNAQSLANRLGKVLRINADGSIPADNPTSFPGIAGSPAGANRAIWAVGLRNPFSLARSTDSGHILVNEVGASAFEEIDQLVAGANYGWPAVEGRGGNSLYRDPIYSYGHAGNSPTGCAITGGTFYEPDTPTFPEDYVGRYFFADYCGGWIYSIDPAAPGAATLFHSGASAIVDLAVGPDGALYVLDAGDGSLHRIRYTGADTEDIIVSAHEVELREGRSATFTVRLAGPPAGNRVVAVGHVLSDATVSSTPASLTFTPTSWQTPKTVTVKAAQDSDRYDEAGTLRLTASGLSPRMVYVTAIDDDRPAGSPRAFISRPRNGDTVTGGNAEYFGDAVEGDGLVKAEFYVDAVLKYSDRNATGHYHIGGDHRLWNTTALADGTRILTMRVVDDQGRIGAHTIRVKVAN